MVFFAKPKFLIPQPGPRWLHQELRQFILLSVLSEASIEAQVSREESEVAPSSSSRGWQGDNKKYKVNAMMISDGSFSSRHVRTSPSAQSTNFRMEPVPMREFLPYYNKRRKLKTIDRLETSRILQVSGLSFFVNMISTWCHHWLTCRP